MYHYRAIVVSVYDGDTITVDIDLGLGIWARGEKLRLARINAPEMRGPDRGKGIMARDYLRDLVNGQTVEIETIKDTKGKYGRYVTEVWITDDRDRININDLMVHAGQAEFRNYGVKV